MNKSYKSLSQIFSVLPDKLVYRLSSLSGELMDHIQELRLRTDKPVEIRCKDKTLYLTEKSFTYDIFNNLSYITVSKGDLLDIFTKACSYSVFNRQNEISHGFVTLSGGHRMGITGSAVYSNGELTNIKDISSLNIRFASEYIGCSRDMIKNIGKIPQNILICGKPCSGKTTLIRDIARSLSLDSLKKVCVIDSRNEISATYRGRATLDIGMCDIFSMYDKINGIEHAIRNMSPDYIICDEIVTKDEVRAISYGINSGVNFIATVHCTDKAELFSKPLFKELLSLNAFDKAILLKDRTSPGQVGYVVDMKEMPKNYAD